MSTYLLYTHTITPMFSGGQYNLPFTRRGSGCCAIRPSWVQCCPRKCVV